MHVDGGEEIRLTATEGLDDGPEYSPDGKYIYFNSYRSGMMQIWRMKPDGSDPEQMTFDQHSNWFAHIAPNSKVDTIITYLEDQEQAHPFGRQVKLRLLDLETKEVSDLTEAFYGGQGTINVRVSRRFVRKLTLRNFYNMIQLLSITYSPYRMTLSQVIGLICLSIDKSKAVINM
jgi:hypothetical protein